MDHDRRLALAAITRGYSSTIHNAVTDSWPDLMAVASTWTEPQRERAHAAVDATLQALAEMLVQGDLEEREWRRVLHLVHGEGRATPEEIDDLLRTVRVVGVERLLAVLERHAGLTTDERGVLKRQVDDFTDRLHRPRDEVQLERLDALLARLEADGPDLR